MVGIGVFLLFLVVILLWEIMGEAKAMRRSLYEIAAILRDRLPFK